MYRSIIQFILTFNAEWPSNDKVTINSAADSGILSKKKVEHFLLKENTPLTTIPPRDYNPKKTILITHKKDHILLFMLIEFETIIIRSMPFIFPFNTLNFF